MAATSTSINPVQLSVAAVKPYSTSPVLGSAVVGVPGLSMTTGEYVKIPFTRGVDGKMVIEAMYLAHTGSTTIYPAIALRVPPSSQKMAWRQPQVAIGTSTAETGWTVVQSTAMMTATSTESQKYVFGPFESARYGLLAATSFGHVGANQMYLEVVMGHTTKAAGTFLSLATNVAGSIYLEAKELP